ncbi:nodulin homeobox-like [Henckelia pumila]|uniref:nodulin homeobox-like n=1 Tax=Henckelia pumila TaxID=405737 RepID=UPI003C6DC583
MWKSFNKLHDNFLWYIFIKVLDLVAAVNTLHDLSAQQLRKLIKDSGTYIIRYVADDGSQFQIDAEKFARCLPLRLIAVIMAWERDKSTFRYLLCGILQLHSMCDLASRCLKSAERSASSPKAVRLGQVFARLSAV